MKRHLIAGLTCILMLLPVLAMGAGTVVTTGQLKAKLDAGEKIILVDTMPPLIYQVMHLPGAINIPADRIADELPGKVPDKGQAVAFYCMGLKCVYTVKAAEQAAKLGYTNILAFREGLPGWQKAGLPVDSTLNLPNAKVEQLSPQDLKARMDQVVLVDIRGSERAKIGVIPGTRVWLPIAEILDKYSTLPRDKEIVIYDTADKLTLVAGRFLISKGYNVKRLGGGAAKWVGSGLPVDTVQ